MIKEETTHQLFLALSDMMQRISVHRLTQFGNCQNVTLKKAIENETQHSDHWAYWVTTHLPAMTISIECHFSTLTAKAMTSKVLQINEDKVDNALAHSFFGEYTNLIVGGLKNSVALILPQQRSSNIQVKEIKLTGPTQIISTHSKNKERDQQKDHQSIWRLGWSDGSILISMEMTTQPDKIESVYGESLKNFIEKIKLFNIKEDSEISYF